MQALRGSNRINKVAVYTLQTCLPGGFFAVCRFAELAKLIDPGNEPKTDKTTILVDAIKYVQQMTVENHQLKQLNKFLEVSILPHCIMLLGHVVNLNHALPEACTAMGI